MTKELNLRKLHHAGSEGDLWGSRMDPMDLLLRSGKREHARSQRNGISSPTRTANHTVDTKWKTRMTLTSDRKHGNRLWEFAADRIDHILHPTWNPHQQLT